MHAAAFEKLIVGHDDMTAAITLVPVTVLGSRHHLKIAAFDTIWTSLSVVGSRSSASGDCLFRRHPSHRSRLQGVESHFNEHGETQNSQQNSGRQ